MIGLFQDGQFLRELIALVLPDLLAVDIDLAAVLADQAEGICPAGERIVQIAGRPVCGCHIIREGDGECFVLPSFCPFPVHIDGLHVLCALCKPV